MNSKTNPIIKYVFPGILFSAAFTAVIAITAANLGGFHIIGKTVPFAYPWRLVEPGVMSRLTAWGGYLLHNLVVWYLIYRARAEKPRYGTDLRWFNWAMIATNVVAIILHILQTQFFYDGLAANVPEITALGSVAVMLMIIIIFETPRRGLIIGKKFKFRDGFMQIARKYHGYLFSWAIVYDFWYHPTENTWGHLMGFFYIFLLFVQTTLIFNRAHINKYWTFALEFFVLIHGVAVALLQGNSMWPMFAFGFGAMVILTQMYGLGLNTMAKRVLAVGFIVVAVGFYTFSGHIAGMNEIIRIPVLDYMFIFILYGIYLLVAWIMNLFKRQPAVEAGTD